MPRRPMRASPASNSPHLLRRIDAERLTAVIGPTFSVTSTGTTK